MHATILALSLLSPAAGPPSGDGDIARLIEQLGDDSQERREAAEKALRDLGRPALWRLVLAFRAHADLEIRTRAGRAARAIDPAVMKRDDLEKGRRAILAKVEAAKGFDARRWGEDLPNPFTNVSPEGRKRLEEEGVDFARLLKMRAVIITGSYCGACSKTLINRDPDTIVVLGDDFITHSGVLSAGPVLAVGEAHIMGSLTVAGPALFTEKSFPRSSIQAAPLLAQPGADHTQDEAVRARLIVKDFGWKRPAGWPDAPKWKAGAKLPPLYVDDAAKKRAGLLAEVKAAKGADTKDLCKPTDNPFKALSEEGKARLRRRGVDIDRLAGLKAVLLAGDHWKEGAIVHRDADTVLVIGRKFLTAGHVYSAGPVVATLDAHFMGPVTGADVVWFADESFPRSRMRGLPVIVTKTASTSQMGQGWLDTWHGDYGWKAAPKVGR